MALCDGHVTGLVNGGGKLESCSREENYKAPGDNFQAVGEKTYVCTCSWYYYKASAHSSCSEPVRRAKCISIHRHLWFGGKKCKTCKTSWEKKSEDAYIVSEQKWPYTWPIHWRTWRRKYRSLETCTEPALSGEPNSKGGVANGEWQNNEVGEERYCRNTSASSRDHSLGMR